MCDESTVCGALDGVLYVYNPSVSKNVIYSYSPNSGVWSAVGNPFGEVAVFAFASDGDKMYLLSETVLNEGGTVTGSQIGYLPNTGDNAAVGWDLVTNINLFGASGDKRVHSLMIVSEGDAPGVQINGKEVAVTSDNSDSKVVKTRVLLRGFDGESFKLRLSGADYCKIHRIDIVYSYSGKRFK